MIGVWSPTGTTPAPGPRAYLTGVAAAPTSLRNDQRTAPRRNAAAPVGILG